MKRNRVRDHFASKHPNEALPEYYRKRTTERAAVGDVDELAALRRKTEADKVRPSDLVPDTL